MRDLFGKIAESGVYDLTPEVYHGDCCDGPSISSSGLKVIALDGPAMFWAGSIFNPRAKPREWTDALAFGSAAHAAILEPAEFERRFIISEYPDFRTNAAKDWRAEQTAAGLIVISEEKAAEIAAMAEAMDEHPLARRMLEAGRVEQSLVWRDGSGLWLKARPDFLPLQSGRWIVDYKTTCDLRRFWNQAVFDLRYDLQAALYHRALKEIAGIEAKGLLFIAQEKKPPYRVGLFPFHADGFVTWRRAERDLAAAIAAAVHGFETGEWPTGYEQPVPMPDYFALKFEKDEQAHV